MGVKRNLVEHKGLRVGEGNRSLIRKGILVFALLATALQVYGEHVLAYRRKFGYIQESAEAKRIDLIKNNLEYWDKNDDSRSEIIALFPDSYLAAVLELTYEQSSTVVESSAQYSASSGLLLEVKHNGDRQLGLIISIDPYRHGDEDMSSKQIDYRTVELSKYILGESIKLRSLSDIEFGNPKDSASIRDLIPILDKEGRRSGIAMWIVESFNGDDFSGARPYGLEMLGNGDSLNNQRNLMVAGAVALPDGRGNYSESSRFTYFSPVHWQGDGWTIDPFYFGSATRLGSNGHLESNVMFANGMSYGGSGSQVVDLESGEILATVNSIAKKYVYGGTVISHPSDIIEQVRDIWGRY